MSKSDAHLVSLFQFQVRRNFREQSVKITVIVYIERNHARWKNCASIGSCFTVGAAKRYFEVGRSERLSFQMRRLSNAAFPNTSSSAKQIACKLEFSPTMEPVQHRHSRHRIV
jgi:hypothetical protein